MGFTLLDNLVEGHVAGMTQNPEDQQSEDPKNILRVPGDQNIPVALDSASDSMEPVGSARWASCPQCTSAS